jgi:hypothetical protein
MVRPVAELLDAVVESVLVDELEVGADTAGRAGSPPPWTR